MRQGKEGLGAGRLEGYQSNVMTPASPVVGQETGDAFRTSRAKVGNDKSNTHCSLAAQKPKPDFDRLIGFMGASALACFEPEPAVVPSHHPPGG